MKSTSLITVTVQGSNVLSPAIFKFLPLKGIWIGVILEAGNCAALTKNLLLSSSSSELVFSGIESAGKNNSH